MPITLPTSTTTTMAEEKHHHLFHHKKEEEEKPIEAVKYSDDTYGSDNLGGGYGETTEIYGTAVSIDTPDYEKEEKKHKHHERLGELGIAAAGVYAVVHY